MINEPTSESPPTDSIPDDQWLMASPRLRGELCIDLRKQGDRLVAIIEDPVRARFFQVGNVEYHFLMMLDGKRAVSEIIKGMQHGRGYSNFDGQSARTICNWLANMNLLDSPAASSTERLCQAAHAKEKQTLMGMLNPVSFRLSLLNPDHTLRQIAPYTRWLFSPIMVVVWIVTGLFALSVVNADYDRFCAAATGVLAADRWAWLLVVWVALKVIHETAHGIACQKYGGEVPQAGLLILLFAPLAFVNVTSSWRFSSRRKRMVVSAAGMYVELLIAFVALLVWYYAGSRWIGDLAYNVVIMAGISTVLFNANPLLRFDGYYLLSDSLGIVNLYGKGQAWFGDRVRHLVFGFPMDPRVCPADELRLVAVYGVCSFVWRVILCISLLLVASTLLGGAGLAFAIIGGVFWVWMPLVQNYRKVRQAASQHPVHKKRMAAVLTILAMLTTGCFYGLQAPAMTRAPAIVQFENEQVIRAAADGFVREIFVRDGQRISSGEPLLCMENPDLVQELETLNRSAQSASIQSRIYRQRGELSLHQAEKAKLHSLQQQIGEVQQQVDQLKIVAPFDGVVFNRELDNLSGSFVHQGDVILHFADPAQKQILISIDQEQIKSLKTGPEIPVRFTFTGIELLHSRITRIEPRASDIPADLAITAAAGGPLAVVRPDPSEKMDDSEFRLISPRFTGKCVLGPEISNRVVSGQRGTAFIRGRDVSLGGYVVLKCKDWIRNKLQTVTQTTL